MLSKEEKVRISEILQDDEGVLKSTVEEFACKGYNEISLDKLVEKMNESKKDLCDLIGVEFIPYTLTKVEDLFKQINEDNNDVIKLDNNVVYFQVVHDQIQRKNSERIILKEEYRLDKYFSLGKEIFECLTILDKDKVMCLPYTSAILLLDDKAKGLDNILKCIKALDLYEGMKQIFWKDYESVFVNFEETFSQYNYWRLLEFVFNFEKQRPVQIKIKIDELWKPFLDNYSDIDIEIVLLHNLSKFTVINTEVINYILQTWVYYLGCEVKVKSDDDSVPQLDIVKKVVS